VNVLSQYVAGVILLVALFFVFSDPTGTASILTSLANLNASAIASLQGRGVSTTAGSAARRK
jgi:hypothetical protein